MFVDKHPPACSLKAHWDACDVNCTPGINDQNDSTAFANNPAAGTLGKF